VTAPRCVKSSRGWSNSFGDNTDLWTGPDGEQYARCRNGERPDVLIQTPKMKRWGIPPLQLRRYRTSSRRRTTRRTARMIARHNRKRGAE
jgi:hypothetical protein